MVIIQARSKRKVTGTIYKSARSKRLFERGGAPAMTKLGEKKVRVVKTKGDGRKVKNLQANTINVFDPKDQKHYNVKITAIVENVANPNFVRRNIMTKGTVIETEKGKARITSRPGQFGSVNAVLI